jgi:cobaltochelatase CobN
MKWLSQSLAVVLGVFVFGLSLAVSAENSPSSVTGAKVMLLTSGHSNPAKSHLLMKLAGEQGLSLIQVKLRDQDKETKLSDLADGFDLVLLDDISEEQTKKNFATLQPQIAGIDNPIRVMALRWPEGETLRKGVSEEQARALADYYHHGGRENFTRMFSYLRASLFGDQAVGAVEPALIFPELGAYHPDHETIFETTADYLAWYRSNHDTNEDTPVVGVIIHKENLVADNTAFIDEMIGRISAEGAIPMAIYYRTGREINDFGDWLATGGDVDVDVVINTRVIHWAEKQQKLFERLGVAVLQSISYSKEEQKWRDDNGGIPAMSIPIYLTFSEIAGSVDPTVTAARDSNDSRHYPIDEQLDLLVRRAVRTARLATLPNKEKKVAILYYNYPPGEKSAGASFLNIPRSVEQISRRMREAGYQTAEINEQEMIDAVANLQRPYYREESPSRVVEKGVGATLSLADYRRWYETLPAAVREPIEEAWGQPEDHYMVAQIDGELQFVIPMFQSGNLMVLPQPPRGEKGEREKSIYHSKSLAINHYYLAVYLYLREKFGADALVHLGTHGSQEWLPGKERGPWAYDPASLTVGAVPVIYPYIVDDVGEALQAKRRGHAVMISHMTPPFAPSGLYRDMSEIHELIHLYASADEGLVKGRTRRHLMEKLDAISLYADMGWQVDDVEARFDEFLTVLHDYLHDLALENQPLGLHTFGELAEDQLLTATVSQILGLAFAEQAIDYHCQTHVCEADDHDDKDDQLAHSYAEIDEGLDRIPGFKLLYETVLQDQAIPADVPEALRTHLERGRELLEDIRAIMEMESFIGALNGKFIMPSTGGDPIRNAESLPTGRNLYGFDPSRLPTKAAYETGQELVSSLIDDYIAKHGKYPDKMAFSLWSIEAMRHHGVLESQVMYAMGLRPVWAENGRVTGTEIIPYSELDRPRIDVVLSATGLYRDAFPGVMQLLAEGVEKIARLKEEDNYVRRNAERLKEEFMASGMSAEESEYLSTVRIFSGATGTYGTGLAAASLASDTWEQDSKLAQLYMDRMGYAFGSDPDRWGEKLNNMDLYAKNLSGTDVAMFSRSSNLYGLLTSDDPFQYLGGISLAVRNLDGSSPEMFISNLRNPKQEKMESLNTFMSKELRTRYFHPRWIGAMQNEGYSGTLNVVDTVNNFWGWQVVDPQNIRADQWQEFFEVYVNDKYEMQMREWFETHNAEALAQISERMLEAIRKGYWQPNEATVEKLVKIYQEIAAKYDVQTINQKFKEFVAEQAEGFGLAKPDATPIPLAAVDIPQPSATAQATQQVEGQKLEKVETESQSMDDSTRQALLMLLLLTLLMGAAWQQWGDDLGRQLRLRFRIA